jgi:hypothetical protein
MESMYKLQNTLGRASSNKRSTVKVMSFYGYGVLLPIRTFFIAQREIGLVRLAITANDKDRQIT